MSERNERGNLVHREFWLDIDGSHGAMWVRYKLLTKRTKHWRQYETGQDAPYFGVWYSFDNWLIATYAEGDLTITECVDKEHFLAEFEFMQEFYWEAGWGVVRYSELDLKGQIYGHENRSRFQTAAG